LLAYTYHEFMQSNIIVSGFPITFAFLLAAVSTEITKQPVPVTSMRILIIISRQCKYKQLNITIIHPLCTQYRIGHNTIQFINISYIPPVSLLWTVPNSKVPQNKVDILSYCSVSFSVGAKTPLFESWSQRRYHLDFIHSLLV